MSDSASASISGFLFQFEKALALLASSIDSNSIVSIEKVDDVAVGAAAGGDFAALFRAVGVLGGDGGADSAAVAGGAD